MFNDFAQILTAGEAVLRNHNLSLIGNKKNTYTPSEVTPQFFYIKLVSNGYTFHGHVFLAD